MRERSKPVCQPSSPNRPQGGDEAGDSQDVGPEAAQHPNRWGALPLAAMALPAAQLRVLGVLAAFADRQGVVTDVGRARLAAFTGMDERTCRRAVTDLGASGWLTCTPGDGGRRSLFVLHRHPLRPERAVPQGGSLAPPPGGAISTPPYREQKYSVPSEPPTAAPPAAEPTAQGDDMHQPDDAQLGFDLGVEAPEPAPKPRKDGGPVQRVVAAYCAAYVAEHGRQPASERARVAGQAKTMLGQGHTEAELTEAADQLGHTRFTYLAEQVRMVRAQTRRVDVAAVGGVEGWQGTGTDGPAGSGPSALDRVYG